MIDERDILRSQRALRRSRWIIGSLALALAGSLAMLGQKPPSNFDRWWTAESDALVAAPQHHKILFENDEVRVLDVTIPPNTREPLHSHRYPSVLYFVEPAHVIEHRADGTSQDRDVPPKGFVRWQPIEPAHSLENVDRTTDHLIRVELKQAR